MLVMQALFGEENGVCYRPDFDPIEAAALASVSASFKHVPDLLYVKQVLMQVGLCVRALCVSQDIKRDGVCG